MNIHADALRNMRKHSIRFPINLKKRPFLSLGLILLLASSTTGHARRVDRAKRLIEMLEGEKNPKIQLQVILGLGRTKDVRAVKPLIELLSSNSASIRAMSAMALGQIGDQSAIATLKQHLASERSSFVKSKVHGALAYLENMDGSHSNRPSNVEMVVAPGAFHHKGPSASQKSLTSLFRQKLLQTMHQSPRVHAAKTAALATKLGKKRNNAYVLDGTIERVTQQTVSDGVVVKCNVRISLSTLPKNSIKAIYTGSASTIVPEHEARGGVSHSTYDSLLESVSESARSYFLQSAVVMAQ